MSDILDQLEPLIADINQAMERLLSEDEPLAADIGRYNFDGGGKRLRPLLFCLISRALGRELTPDLLDISVSFEFLHMATLLHDDIVDQAEVRRGRAAAHLRFGVPETVLAGDYLLAKSALLGVRAQSLRCTQIMAEVVAALSLGELTQLAARREPELSRAAYFDIIYRKPAALMEGSVASAAVLAGADEERLAALKLYGRNLGLAFQIMDDVLDYEGEAATFGKPVGHDLDEGRVTLPFILARENLERLESAELKALALLEQRGPAELGRVLELLRLGQGPSAALAEAGELVKDGVRALAALPAGQARDQLEALAFYCIKRDH